MKAKKYFATLFLVVIFASSGAAHHIEFHENTIAPGDTVDISFECNPDQGDCSTTNGYSIAACRDAVAPPFQRELDNGNYYYAFQDGNGVDYPDRFSQCSYGENQYSYYDVMMPDSSDSSHQSGGSLTVQERGYMHPHKGKYIYAGLNTNKNNIHHFFLSDNTYDGWNVEEPGMILTEFNPGNVLGDNYDVAAVRTTADIESSSKSELTIDAPGSLDEIGTTEEASCGSGSCGVDDASFGDGYDNKMGEYHQHGFSWPRDTMSPIHTRGDYTPDGEIIAGYEPSTHEPYWFICRYETSSDLTVNIGSEDNPDLYQCNPSTQEWEEYTSNCPDETVGTVAEGPLGLQRYKAALWDHDPSGSYTNARSDNDCRYNHASPESYQQYEDWGDNSAPVTASQNDPETFECNRDGEITGYYVSDQGTTYADDSETQAESACAAIPQGLDSSAYNPYASYEDHFSQFGGEPIPMVQYYIPMAAIPYGEEGSQYISRYGDYKGFETHQFQTLYEAMQKYDGGDYESQCENCTDVEIWEENKSMITDTYDETDHTTYENAWETANVGGNKDKRIREESPYAYQIGQYSGEPEDPTIFPGGFAGDCEGTLAWQYVQSQWRCSPAVDYTQEIHTPTFDLSGSNEMVAVGFHIMPTLFNNTVQPQPLGSDIPQTFTYQTQGVLSESQTIDEVSAVCWWGDNDRYTELEESAQGQTWFSVEYTNIPESPQNPIPVWGELNKTVKQDRGLGGPSCKWAYGATPGLLDPNSEGLDVYTISGEVESVTRNANSIAQQRNFTGGSGVSVQQDYTSKMTPNIFRTFSQMWEDEAGYTRNEPNCVPEEDYFNRNVTMPCSSDLPPIYEPIYGSPYGGYY